MFMIVWFYWKLKNLCRSGKDSARTIKYRSQWRGTQVPFRLLGLTLIVKNDNWICRCGKDSVRTIKYRSKWRGTQVPFRLLGLTLIVKYDNWICRCGGIGIRARLRGVWRNPWGFKSPHRHHKADWGLSSNLLYSPYGYGREHLLGFSASELRAKVFSLEETKFLKRETVDPLNANEQDKSPHRHYFNNVGQVCPTYRLRHFV